MNVIEIKVINPAILEFGLPSTETSGAAGYDLRAAIDHSIIIPSGETASVPTGIALFINDRSVAGLIMPRSGLAANFSVTLQNAVGLLDSDYQGEVKVLLRNEGFDAYKVNPGDRVAQLVFIPVIHPIVSVITHFTNKTDRGGGGFGSTGISSRSLSAIDPNTVTELDNPEGRAFPTQKEGNDLPITLGIDAPAVPMYVPTGQELLEAVYGED